MHGFRSELEWALMNIFYFMEKGHKEAMTSEVVKALNAAYRNFMFFTSDQKLKPRVMVVAHSLGSVIMHEITTSDIGLLDFKIDHFIMVGSPTGLFLAIRSSEKDYKAMPSEEYVGRIYNLNNNLDPVYYRFGLILYHKK